MCIPIVWPLSLKYSKNVLRTLTPVHFGSAILVVVAGFLCAADQLKKRGARMRPVRVEGFNEKREYDRRSVLEYVRKLEKEQ